MCRLSSSPEDPEGTVGALDSEAGLRQNAVELGYIVVGLGMVLARHNIYLSQLAGPHCCQRLVLHAFAVDLHQVYALEAGAGDEIVDGRNGYRDVTCPILDEPCRQRMFQQLEGASAGLTRNRGIDRGHPIPETVVAN